MKRVELVDGDVVCPHCGSKNQFTRKWSWQHRKRNKPRCSGCGKVLKDASRGDRKRAKTQQ